MLQQMGVSLPSARVFFLTINSGKLYVPKSNQKQLSFLLTIYRSSAFVYVLYTHIHTLFVGIQVIVHGEGFLILQEMRIQKPSWESRKPTLNLGNACTLTWVLVLTVCYMSSSTKGSIGFGTSINHSPN